MNEENREMTTNEIIINRNSWHYRFINQFCSTRYIHDICGYRKEFLKACIAAMLVSAICALLVALTSFVIVHLVLGLLSPLIWGHFMLSDVAVAAVLFFMGSIIAFSCLIGFKQVANLRVEGEMYRSWKEKYCKNVSFR